MSASSGDRWGGETAATILLAMTILLFAPVSFAYNGVLANMRPSMKNDFTSYYVAGLAVREGTPEALYYPHPVGSLLAQASQQHPWIDLARSAGIEDANYYLYPPLFAVLFAPLTLLPYRTAYVVWAGLSALFLALSVVMLRSLEGKAARAPSSSRSMMTTAALVLVACLFYPASRSLAVGQSSLLLLALMTATLVTLRQHTRKGDVCGGLCLAGGIMLKLTPALFLIWLAMGRRWRALAWSLGALGGLLAASVLCVGVGPHEVYAREMVGQLAGGTAFYPNQSLGGMLARAAGGDMRLADLVDPSAASVVIARLLGLAVIAVSLLAIWRRRLDDDHAFAILTLALLMISPISWEHHYVLALIPAWLLIRDATSARRMSAARAAAAGGALALVGSYIGLRVIEAAGASPIGQVVASACLLGGAILWGLLVLGPPGRNGRKASPAALLVLVSVFAAGNFLFKIVEYSRAYRFGDFTSYYVAGATLLDGIGPLYYPETPDMILARAETPSPWTETARKWGVREANYYLYPPFFAMVMMPMAMIPYGAAHVVWYLANLLALGGCVWVFMAMRRQPDEAWPSHELALSVIAFALSWPALFSFGAGQANYVVLLLLLGALAALRAGREVPAGLMVAGAAAIKITPALLLVYLAWRRRWAALTAAAVGLAALVVAGAAAAGWSSYGIYVGQMVPLLSRGCAHWINESLAAFFTRLVDGGDLFSWGLADPSIASRFLTGATGALLIAGSFWLVGRREVSLDLEFALLVVTTLFISPLSWTHHSVLSLMSLLLVARYLVMHGEMTLPMAAALAVSFTLVHVYVKPPGILEGRPMNALASYNLLGNLMLWGIIAKILRRGGGSTHEA